MSEKQNIKDQLQPDFIRASINLVSKSIVNWERWVDLDGFPDNGSWGEKLLFIDSTLQNVLSPMRHRPNERMFWRTRPDLNKYRGWLLNRVLQHQMAVQNGLSDSHIILLEDLPKLVDDLYLFHKHHKAISRKNGEDAGTLHHYKSLAELNSAISPYEASYPLDTSERTKNHERFIAEDGGNGGAVRLATLKDGTEIIQVLTEDASRAYGSPRWCTAYQNQDTYFEEYKDDLLIVIDPDGQRWQFHFRTNQLHDENDRPIDDIAGFLNDREDLASVLTPYWENGVKAKIEEAQKHWYHQETILLLDLALSVSSFKQHASKRDGFLDRELQNLSFERKNDNKNLLLSIAQQLKDVSAFQALLEPHIFERGIPAFNEEIREPTNDYFSAQAIAHLWKIILITPAWKTRAIAEGHLKTVFVTLLKSGGDNALDTFITLTNNHSQDSEVRQEVTPIIFNEAFQAFHKDLKNEAVSMTLTYMQFYDLLMSDLEWKEMALAKDINAKALPLLDRTFASYDPETGIYTGLSVPARSDYVDFCILISRIPEWKKHAEMMGHFSKAVSDEHLARHFDEYEGHAKENKFFGTTSRDYIKYFWENVLSVPEWAEYARKENRLGRMLDILFDEDLKPKRGLGYFNDFEKNDPAKTFMFMMRKFYNRPGFRESMTPYITAALDLGKGEEASFKIPFSRRLACVNITAEILQYAERCRQWREQITAHVIENALQDEKDLPNVVAVTAGVQISCHWRDAVMASSAVPEFLQSESPYKTDSVKEIIFAHPQYREAFEQFLVSAPE